MDVPLYTDPLYQAAALALFDAGGVTRESVGPVMAVWFDASHVTFLYDAPSYDPSRLGASATSVWAIDGVEVVDIVLVGGDRERFDIAREQRPAYTGQRTLGVTWVTPGGPIEVDRTSRRVADALRAALASGVPPLRDRQLVDAKVAEALRNGRSQAEELAAFQQQLGGRKARVTWGLFAAIAALFVMKWAIGEHGLATDVHMGALVPGRVLAEPWRLLSHAFLHASMQHVFFNGMSLLSLGAFYERLLGPRRFATLFVASAIGGGVAACFGAPDTVMVGASGALWGMLGVSFALALRPGATLPAALLAGFRRNAGVNFGIQVMVSLIPNVSWQAHLGGGLVGFALMMSGVLRPKDEGDGGRAWGVSAALSMALSVVCVALALGLGRPWELRAPPVLRPYALDGTTVTVSLPERPRGVTVAGRREFLAGDPLADGYGVGVQVVTMSERIAPEALAATVEEARSSLGELGHPSGATAIGPIRTVAIAGLPSLAQDFQLPQGVRFENRLVVRSAASVSVQVLRRADDDRTAGLCDRIAATARER